MKTESNLLDVVSRGNEFWLHSSEIHRQGLGLIHTLADFLDSQKAKPIYIRLFSPQSAVDKVVAELAARRIDCPVICILQNDLGEENIQIQVHAMADKHFEMVYDNGMPVGQRFEDNYATYYMFNMLPDDGQVSRYEQIQNVFEKAQRLLRDQGLDFSSTVRTWLFADRILTWYDQLNQARNKFFHTQHIYDKLVPASTGVGVYNPYGRALAAQVLAVQPKNGHLTIGKVDSPMQCAAMNYRSSFSRAVKITGPKTNRIYISGTASIDQDGKTVFVNDTSSQIDRTMQVVEAILKQENMTLTDTTGAIAYFKHRQDFGLFDDYCRKQGIQLPHVKVHADICRDDLLFELELEAAS